MLFSVIAAVVVLAAWSLAAGRLERWRVTAPIVLVLAGIAVAFGTHDALAAALNTETVQRAAEVILAVLLFVDATDVRGGLFGRDPRSALRVLFIALPLGLALSVALGLWLLPGLSWAVLLIIACVVVPIDFAPATSILRDENVPDRVRDALNVEAGYNDGIVSPVFIFALVLAGDHSHAETPMAAISAALPQSIKAIVVGLAVGVVVAVLSNVAERRELMTEQSKRVILVATPLVAYTLSIAAHGNGFVSAFVCGIAFIGLRRSQNMRRELELIDDVGFPADGRDVVRVRCDDRDRRVGRRIRRTGGLLPVGADGGPAAADHVGAARIAVHLVRATASRLARSAWDVVDRVRFAGL